MFSFPKLLAFILTYDLRQRRTVKWNVEELRHWRLTSTKLRQSFINFDSIKSLTSDFIRREGSGPLSRRVLVYLEFLYQKGFLFGGGSWTLTSSTKKNCFLGRNRIDSK